MMDGFMRICRHCNTAYYEGFPRVNCLCGKNEAAPEANPQPAPVSDRGASDPYGYDMAPTTPDADRVNRKDAPLDDALSWWT